MHQLRVPCDEHADGFGASHANCMGVYIYRTEQTYITVVPSSPLDSLILQYMQRAAHQRPCRRVPCHEHADGFGALQTSGHHELAGGLVRY